MDMVTHFALSVFVMALAVLIIRLGRYIWEKDPNKTKFNDW